MNSNKNLNIKTRNKYVKNKIKQILYMKKWDKKMVYNFLNSLGIKKAINFYNENIDGYGLLTLMMEGEEERDILTNCLGLTEKDIRIFFDYYRYIFYFRKKFSDEFTLDEIP